MSRPSRYFRAGVGAVVLDPRGRVLVLERADVPGAWQFPQGGLDDGETPLAAARREAEEETGIPAGALRLLGRYPDPLAYELPKAAQSKRTGMGQVQYLVLLPDARRRGAARAAAARRIPGRSMDDDGPRHRRSRALPRSALHEAGPLSHRAAALALALRRGYCLSLVWRACCARASCSRIGSVCSNEMQASVMLWPNVACRPGA